MMLIFLLFQIKQEISSINSITGAFCVFVTAVLKLPNFDEFINVWPYWLTSQGKTSTVETPPAQHSILAFSVPSCIPRSPTIRILSPRKPQKTAIELQGKLSVFYICISNQQLINYFNNMLICTEVTSGYYY